MNTLQMIEKKLREVSLPDFQITLWNDVLSNLSEDSLNDILGFIESDEDAIYILTDNLVAKEEAIKNGDIDQLEQLLQKDSVIVNSI